MHQRALKYVEKLNAEGWVINEQMADQFVIFARSECARTVQNVLMRIKVIVDAIKLDDF